VPRSCRLAALTPSNDERGGEGATTSDIASTGRGMGSLFWIGRNHHYIYQVYPVCKVKTIVRRRFPLFLLVRIRLPHHSPVLTRGQLRFSGVLAEVGNTRCTCSRTAA